MCVSSQVRLREATYVLYVDQVIFGVMKLHIIMARHVELHLFREKESECTLLTCVSFGSSLAARSQLKIQVEAGRSKMVDLAIARST